MAEVKRSLLVGAPRILYHLSICTSTQQMIVLGLWMRGWPTTVYAFFCVLPFFLFATSIDKVVSQNYIHFFVRDHFTFGKRHMSYNVPGVPDVRST